MESERKGAEKRKSSTFIMPHVAIWLEEGRGKAKWLITSIATSRGGGKKLGVKGRKFYLLKGWFRVRGVASNHSWQGVEGGNHFLSAKCPGLT